MKAFSSLLCSILFLNFISSCFEKSKRINDESLSYEWSVVDSLDLDILGDPLIADVNLDASKFLFYDFASKELITTDKNGEILAQFSKKEDTPDSYGFMMEVPGFFKQDQIVVTGMKGIFLYDMAGTMTQKITHPESIGAAGFMSSPGKATESTSLNGQDFLLSKSLRSHDSFQGEMKFYESFHALELIDPRSNTLTEIVPFEEGSMFLNGTGYYESDYSPAFVAKDGKLYVSLGAEPRLCVYDLSPGRAVLDTIISFSIPDYQELKPKDFSEFSEGSVTLMGSTPSIKNIHLLNGKILVHYYAGISPEKMKEAEALWVEGKEEEAEELYEKLELETSQGILIFDQKTLKLEADIPFPDGISKGGFASGGGYLWMEKASDKDVEEDFLRIYKMKLTSK